MKRLKLLILIFCAALCIPVIWLVLGTYRGLQGEETAKLRYFVDTLFDQMENELAELVIREEARAFDEYSYRYSPVNRAPGQDEFIRSPLSHPPQDDYIIGYLQNNPDGSFQSPLFENLEQPPPEYALLALKLETLNRQFNQKRFQAMGLSRAHQPSPMPSGSEGKQKEAFSEQYLDLSQTRSSKAYLGHKTKRVEEITPTQAQNIVRKPRAQMESELRQSPPTPAQSAESAGMQSSPGARTFRQIAGAKDRSSSEPENGDPSQTSAAEDSDSIPSEGTGRYQVEAAPLQNVFIGDDEIFLFRRIMIDDQIYRQGVVFSILDFLNHLARAHYAPQPLARFTQLGLAVMDRERETELIKSGAGSVRPRFTLSRTFPAPFDFIKATLRCDAIPASAGRTTLNIMLAVLGSIMLLGLWAIYQSAKTVMDMSERRSGFVSSVTHELKTPLTNIRMYIEMLEQGIARDHAREQEYYQILGSESERLSRLVNNVLDLSKLEQKQRHFQLEEGTLEDVIQTVGSVMSENLRQEGFTLRVETTLLQPFKYDREAMIQVLINLIDNSIKFGKNAKRREITLRVRPEGKWVIMELSDTGPGIPHHALKKVFDEFYRAEDALTRTTRGTGIGLALVKKFVTAMGGSVAAANNSGAGCTISIKLPTE